MQQQMTVDTPAGPARITRYPAVGRRRAVLAVSHGAGGGIEAPDLQALAAVLPDAGIEVALVEQPWRVAGKRLAPAPKTLDAAWRALIPAYRERAAADVPLFTGGRSAGARVACRTGREVGATGVLALAFPLHPPGKPEKSRAHELLETGLPTLVVQGAADAFGSAQHFPELPTTHRLVGLPAGTHEFAVRKTQEPVLERITEAVAAWIESLI